MTTDLSYWFQKGAGSPLATWNGKTPKTFLDKNYKNAKVTTLPNSVSIKRLDLIAAALHAGYGDPSVWRRSLKMTGSERARLYRYLVLRAELAILSLAITNTAIRPQTHWRMLESSERATLSFSVGSFVTSIAATQWLKQYSSTVAHCLHLRVFLCATLVQKPLAKISGEKVPDFLIEDSSGHWHVFESKGSEKPQRWRKLLEGLQQVEHVGSVGYLGKTQVPRSQVCVHTLVQQDVDLEITLLDPPHEEGTDKGEITIVPDVLHISLALDSIDMFKALEASRVEDIPLAVFGKLSDDLHAIRSAAFGGLKVAIPRALLDLEGELRDLGVKANDFMHRLRSGQAQAAGGFLNSELTTDRHRFALSTLGSLLSRVRSIASDPNDARRWQSTGPGYLLVSSVA